MSKTSHFHPLIVIWAQNAFIEKGTFHLKNIESKVLYSASRPKKYRNFILASQFIHLWIANIEAFNKEPPEIGLVYSNMPFGEDEIAHAIPICLTNPRLKGTDWLFEIEEPQNILNQTHYKNVALFIDWLPSITCPLPIQILFPNMHQ